MVDLDEEEHGEKNDRSNVDHEDKDYEADVNESSKRKSRKIRSFQRDKRTSRSRSRSRSASRKRSISKSQKSWKSANAWLNFMQHFRENLGSHALRSASIFRLASKQWNEMSMDEKQPYIDAANKAKRKKIKEKENNEENEKSSRKRTGTNESKVFGVSNTKIKNKNKYNKSDSEYDSGEDDSMKNYESDNASVDSGGSA